MGIQRRNLITVVIEIIFYILEDGNFLSNLIIILKKEIFKDKVNYIFALVGKFPYAVKILI